jgi:histidinol-phosphate/aromatic aminotransferase/cobyric acid decarboxylase-like protein
MARAGTEIETTDAREIVTALAGGGAIALAVPCEREYAGLATIHVPFLDDFSIPETLDRAAASLVVVCDPCCASGTRVPPERLGRLAAARDGRLLVDARDALDDGAIPDVPGATVLRRPRPAADGESLRTTRERTIRALRAFRFDVWPSESAFVLARVGADARELERTLLARGARVRVPAAPRLADCLRIEVGSDAEMERFFAALTEIATGRRPRG